MVGSHTSPLESLSAGEQATEAFELLSNETRLAILVALWERYDPFDADTAVRFSALRNRVGTVDSGQFNYHLDRLDGHFVESVEDGYRITDAGLKFVRSVIAGAGIEVPTFERSEIETTCTLCGGSVEVFYESGNVGIVCTECDGLWAGDRDEPVGLLGKFRFDPAGLAERSPAEVYAASWVRGFQRLYSMIEGVCPTCSGRIERSLEHCADHEREGRCPNCGRQAGTAARFRCTVCKEGARSTIGGVAKYHPRVVAFYYDRGLGLQYGFNDLATIKERLRRTDSSAEVLSRDPLRVRVTATIDGEGVWIDLDENLRVVDVDA